MKTIEPTLKPYQPNHSRPGADHGERQVVRLHRVAHEADPPADDQREHAAGDTGVDVHDRAAGVVEVRDVRVEPAAAPDVVGDREVAERDPDRQEDDPGGQLHAVGDGAGDQRRGDHREGELEEHVDVVAARDAVQAEHRERVGDQLAVAVADAVAAPALGPAPQDEHDADDRQGDVGHHHHVEHGLRPGHPAVEQGERRGRHHEDEGRRHEHPGVVAVHGTSMSVRWGPARGHRRPRQPPRWR